MASDERYERGLLDGKTAANIAEHAEHLKTINSSLETLAKEQRAQTVLLQEMSSAAAARNATAVASVNAVKQDQAERRAARDFHWSPWQKAAAIIIPLASLVVGYLALTHKIG